MMRPPFVPIPDQLRPLYLKLRITLAIGILFVGSAIAYAFLFPTITTSFDFRNPKSSKNQIFDPRSETATPRTNGKLEAGGNLIANTSPLGDFSHLAVTLDLEKKSETPNAIDVTVRKSYRAYRYPIGDPLTDFPAADLYRIDDDYYALRDGVLRPFVSATAFLSRYPAERAKTVSSEWRDQQSLAPDFIGFRVGSLLSFADGVYVVSSETEIRPIGSAEIFLALGYRFEDVIPVNEEDLGIYKRGRIFLLGAPHSDGTLFQDQDSDALFLIDHGFRRPVLAGTYRDFLISKTTPIRAVEPSETATARCDALPGLFPGALHCTTTLDPFRHSLGPDYEVTLTGADTDIDIATFTLAFETRLDASNVKTLLAKVKQRILARFGFGTP